MSLLSSMPHRCTIRKRTRTRGDTGGSKDIYTNTSTDVECWAQVASEGDTIEFEKRGMVINRKVYFPSDPGIDEQYQIIVTSFDGGSTSVATASQIPLEVRTKSAPDASAGKRKLWKVFAEERTGRRETI